jgi:hypothetical protein
MPKSAQRVPMDLEHTLTVSSHIYPLLYHFTSKVSKFFLEMSMQISNLSITCTYPLDRNNQFLPLLQN